MGRPKPEVSVDASTSFDVACPLLMVLRECAEFADDGVRCRSRPTSHMWVIGALVLKAIGTGVACTFWM